jgi:hypothetical protein
MAALGNPPATLIALVVSLKTIKANSSHSKTRLIVPKGKVVTSIALCLSNQLLNQKWRSSRELL